VFGGRKTKISELDVTIGGKKEIVGLHIAVNNAERMEITQRENGLGDVELGSVDRKGRELVEQGIDIASCSVFHHKVKRARRLESIVRMNEEGVLNTAKDFGLITNVFERSSG